MPSSGTGRRLYVIDGLRGIAALCVLGYHVRLFSNIDIASHGYLAVDLFFMISGFVLARSYGQRLETDLGAVEFLKIRLARIYPCAFIGLLIGLAVLFAGLNPYYRPGFWAFGELLLVPMLAGNSMFPINEPVWSLLFELAANFFHAAALRKPALASLALVNATFAIGLALAVFSFGSVDLGWRPGINAACGLLRVGYGYTGGILLFRLVPSELKTRIPLYAISFPILFLMLFVPSHVPEPAFDLVALFLIFPAILALSAISGCGRVMRTSGRFLGDISYPLYAIHMPLVLLIAAVIEPTSPISMRAPAWLAGSSVILVSGWLLEIVIDKPLRRYLSRRRAT